MFDIPDVIMTITTSIIVGLVFYGGVLLVAKLGD